MSDESIKRYDVTFVEDIQSGETAEHAISANHVEIREGNLCFYAGLTSGRFFQQRKLVAAYAAGVWVSFNEYEDEDELEWEPESQTFDEESWNQFVAEAVKRGKDGSIGG